MRSFVIILLVLFFGVTRGNAQDPDAPRYMPLKVGNIYVFYNSSWHIGPPIPPKIYKGKIIGDTLLNGKKYYITTGFPYLNPFVRIDSSTGSLLMYDSDNICPYYDQESVIDSLSALSGSIIKNCGYLGSNQTNSCHIFSLNIFGMSATVKQFSRGNYNGVGSSWNTARYAKDIGLVYYEEGGTGGGDSWGTKFNLRGCVLDGMVYGDTTDTTRYLVNSITNHELLQNYPNPFNSKTNIMYKIADVGSVNVSIYDNTGRLVDEIFNGIQERGIYESQFDATNLPSGIYFCSLVISNKFRSFVYSKRIVLLK